MKKLVQKHTAKRLKKLDTELRRVAGTPEDADAIHDLRVAIRRLSRELRVFEAWFDAGQVKKIRRRLRKLMGHCAAVRNCDVAVDVLRAAGWRSPELSAGLEQERRRTREVLVRKLHGWLRRRRVKKWRRELRAGRGPAKPGDNIQGSLPAMIEDLFRAGQEASKARSSHYTMHQFRLKTKRVRYTLELFESVYGEKTKEIMESLKGLQEKLGAINDCATTLEMIRRNRNAAAAVRRLAGEREAEFRTHWKANFGSREELQWKAVLGAAEGNS